jgi:hypothetical protein
VKLKKHDQEVMFGSKVGLLQESGHSLAVWNGRA